MKKNFRMISAAAAALLAVAPVLSINSGAKADVIIGGNVVTKTTTTPTTASHHLTINFTIPALQGVTAKQALDATKVSVDGASISNSNYVLSLYKDGHELSSGYVLSAGGNYQIKVTNLRLSGPIVGETYDVKGGTIDNNTSDHIYNGSELGIIESFMSDKFSVYDKTSGSVTFYDKKTNADVKNGYVIYGNTNKVSDLAKLITNAYSPRVYYGDTTVKWNETSVENAIKDALKSVGVYVNNDSIPYKPASTFTINVPATATNGSKSTLPITVLVDTNDHNDNPGMPTVELATGHNMTLTTSGKDSYDLKLNVNDKTSESMIASQFTAKYLSSDNNYYLTPIYVKSSNLNTSAAGKYTVVLEALNPSTKLTRDIKVNVTVGNPDSIKTVEAGKDTAKIVMINGNNVTTTNQTLENGAKVATYGTVTINGVSYTRLNGTYSNQYVETKYVNGSIKPVKKDTDVTDEHARIYLEKRAIIYNIDHQAKGSYKVYSGHNVYSEDGEPVVYTLNNGVKAFKLSDGRFKGSYIDIRNVQGYGVVKTVRITSRIFNSRGRAISTKQYGRYIRRNKKIMTYGIARIHGSRMYKLARNVYVKAYNLR